MPSGAFDKARVPGRTAASVDNNVPLDSRDCTALSNAGNSASSAELDGKRVVAAMDTQAHGNARPVVASAYAAGDIAADPSAAWPGNGVPAAKDHEALSPGV